LKRIKKYNLVTIIILALIYLGNVMSTSFNQRSEINKNIKTENTFIGSESCKSCHKDIYESHIKTAHYLTSHIATKDFIKGSFDAGKNHFVYNKFMEVVLDNDNDSFFQTAFINGIAYQTEPFDIVIGSGGKGQTYLYFDSGRLFQLPVSYYTPLNSWCNSPGYPTNYIRFNRRITGECIECHGTYATINNETKNDPLFDKQKIIYGVDCERCHGPASQHVDFHKQHPDEKKAQFIINAKLMNRQQRLDACALCHSGFRKEIQPAFSFKVGDKLDDFSTANYSSDTASSLDVHGNQYGLLTSSKCFINSPQMDCSSCHNVHVKESNNPKLFSERCMTCHNTASHNTCTVSNTKGLVLKDNCIDCHMPALPSQKIFLQVADPNKSTADLVRMHRVGIYENSTKDYLKRIKSASENHE